MTTQSPIAIVAVNFIGEISVGWFEKPLNNQKLYTEEQLKLERINALKECAELCNSDVVLDQLTYQEASGTYPVEMAILELIEKS